MAAQPDTAVASGERAEPSPEPESAPREEGPTGKRDLERMLNRTFGMDLEEILPEDLQGVLEDVEDRLEKMQNSEGVREVRAVIARLELLLRMFGAAAEGRSPLPWRSAAGIVGAAVYIADPMGLLPSFLKGDDSLLDDALVAYLCYRLVEVDLKRFAEEEEMDASEYGFTG